MSPLTRTILRLVAACVAIGPFGVEAQTQAQTQPQTPVAEPTALVDQQHCMFCHTSDEPFLAPSFHEIAQHYRSVPNASEMLEQKLRHGGPAHWGDMAMPLPADRGGQLSADDAHTLIQWVMSQ